MGAFTAPLLVGRSVTLREPPVLPPLGEGRTRLNKDLRVFKLIHDDSAVASEESQR